MDPDPEYIKTFDDLEEAKKELAKRKTSISKFENHNMTFYSVEEYVIEENEFEFDEDEKKLVKLRYVDRMTQSGAAKVLCTSQVGVSRREKAVLLKLRKELT